MDDKSYYNIPNLWLGATKPGTQVRLRPLKVLSISHYHVVMLPSNQRIFFPFFFPKTTVKRQLFIKFGKVEKEEVMWMSDERFLSVKTLHSNEQNQLSANRLHSFWGENSRKEGGREGGGLGEIFDTELMKCCRLDGAGIMFVVNLIRDAHISNPMQ